MPVSCPFPLSPVSVSPALALCPFPTRCLGGGLEGPPLWGFQSEGTHLPSGAGLSLLPSRSPPPSALMAAFPSFCPAPPTVLWGLLPSSCPGVCLLQL